MSVQLSKASNTTSWALACRLFGDEEPALESALSDAERCALAALGELRAVKQHKLDLRYVLCPYCQLHRGQVIQSAHDMKHSLACQCPDCGLVPVDDVDRRAWIFAPDWLIRKLRGALSIPAQQGAVPVISNMWRLSVRPYALARASVGAVERVDVGRSHLLSPIPGMSRRAASRYRHRRSISQKAAVHGNRLAGDKRGAIGCEEDGHARNVVCRRETPHGETG